MTQMPFSSTQWSSICGEATALLQQLIRFDTTNPPGNELPAIAAVATALQADGLAPEVLLADPLRANLVCRLSSSAGAKGGSDAPPLLLAAHIDVVAAGELSRWTHPPFSGALVDGMIWGRGAVDMKNMVTMSTMVMKLLARQNAKLRRDVILAVVADEEEGCRFGSQFLVEQHPEKVRAGFALGEVGGFPLHAAKAKLIPIQTAEKGMCWLRIKVKGPTGHGSIPREDNAIVRLSELLARLGHRTLPQHTTPVVQDFVRLLAHAQGKPAQWVVQQLLNPQLSGLILKHAFPDRDQARSFYALLHNTVSPTVTKAGEKINVIAGEAEAWLDGRVLPGQTTESFLRELREIVGADVELEVLRENPGVMNYPADSELYRCIVDVLGRHCPDYTPCPTMIPGFTDAQYFSRLGLKWYGFSPLWLNPSSGLKFSELFHGYDERIPEDGFHWGLRVLHEVVSAFCVA